ncbi:DinB family protein [Alteromonas sediminis]|uniref:DinB family protein n=1 Tax=Alteromonas sediminis TaxID=2259342 RepID=A0A3N5XXM8_9ALTE|nr:DinB family protein [Alteromonas sediminis]RPJ65230.1 DinB family protein [Alteromonas sediminis]
MTTSAATPPVDSFLAPVHHANIILKSLSNEQYDAIPPGPFNSSIGEHIRHILDHYQALMLGLGAAYIDYNQRARHSSVESDLSMALTYWEQVSEWLANLSEQEHEKKLKVVTEHNTVWSTLGRELSFVSSHAIHHFAFIKQLAAAFAVSLPSHVGVAPATLKSQQA